MNSDQINEQARAILLGLNGHSEKDVVRILSAAISLTVAQSGESDVDPVRDAGYVCRSAAWRRAKLDRYPEISEFLQGLDHYMTLNALYLLLVEKFGKERAPSKTALSRFFRKLENRTSKRRMQPRKRGRK